MVRTRSPDTEVSLRHKWITGIIAAILAVAAYVAKSQWDPQNGLSRHHQFVTWIAVPILLAAGIFGVGRLADAMGQVLSRREAQAAGAVVRLVATGLGYLTVLFGVFSLLGVSLSHLLIGFGVAGVVLGIAAQQSLANIFASMVLLFARPFSVGEHIRIRSGTIGIIDAWVLGIGLTYVTLQTEDGLLKVPNSVLLASGIGKLDAPPLHKP